MSHRSIDPASPAELAFLELVANPRRLHAWATEVRYRWIERWAIQNETRLAAENWREMGPLKGLGFRLTAHGSDPKAVSREPNPSFPKAVSREPSPRPKPSRQKGRGVKDPRQRGFEFDR